MSHTSSGLKKLMKRMRKLGFIINKRNGKDIVSHPKAEQSYIAILEIRQLSQLFLGQEKKRELISNEKGKEKE